MADEGTEDTQQNPIPEGTGGDTGQDRKLYAGKFQSDAELEKGYTELEKTFHDTRQKLRDVEDKVSQLTEYASRDRADYSRQTTPDMNAQVLQTFYQDPIRVLQEVKEVAKREMKEEMRREQATHNSEAAKVKAWTDRNRDIEPYRDLMGYYVQDVTARNPRLDTTEKLDEAARLTRARALELQRVAQTHRAAPNSEDHREAPSGASGAGRGFAPAANAGDVNDPEVRMKAYLADRAKLRLPRK